MKEQCKGITKSGNRCKNSQGLVDGYCRLHKDQASDGTVDEAEEKTRNDDLEDERTFADVASDVNEGVSAMFLIITAVLSIIVFWLFKGRKKRKRYN